jgi:hypothetical protein
MGVESIALNAKAGQSREKDTQTTFAAVRVEFAGFKIVWLGSRDV